MAKRRSQGDGALFLNGKGLWEARIELPPDPETGKRRRKVIRAKKKKDAMERLKQLQADLTAAGDLTTAPPKYGDWVKQTWIPGLYRRSLKPRTINDYISKLENYIIPVIGKTGIDKITATHVHRVIDYVRDTKGLTSITARQTYNTLNMTLKDAVKRGLITRNPCERVDPPVRTAVPKQVPVLTQIRDLLDRHKGTEMFVLLLLLIYTSARRGEAIGLRVEDIDFANQTIRFEWSLQRLTWKHGCAGTCGRKRGADCPDRHIPIADGIEASQVDGTLWLTRPKTKTSRRVMPLVAPLAEALARLIQQKNLQLGDFVFGQGGQPMTPEEFYADVNAALATVGSGFTPHTLRYASTSLMDQAGVSEAHRVSMMGHSSAQMTRHYTRTAMDTLATEVSKVVTLIEG